MAMIERVGQQPETGAAPAAGPEEEQCEQAEQDDASRPVRPAPFGDSDWQVHQTRSTFSEPKSPDGRRISTPSRMTSMTGYNMSELRVMLPIDGE